ncbi:hypothetical protein, partial [Escherichia coli]|uniref:hypothetical protein n=2 Tax=Escherichia coli TaxID=562 RepID=UPI001C5E9242
ADRNRSHWSTSKTPSYTKSVSWQHHLLRQGNKSVPDLQRHHGRKMKLSVSATVRLTFARGRFTR